MTPASHIFTLTGNLLAERTLEFDRWAPGKTQRAVRESFQVGGKGINVSKMLNRLGAANTALCFTGGASGAEAAEWLQARGFGFRAFSTDRATRTGTVVRGGEFAETSFLGADVPPSAEALRACAGFLEAQADGQVLALCGSFPAWDDARYDPLRGALDRWLARGTLVADTYGAPLAWVAHRPLALVKINTGEFAALLGRPPVFPADLNDSRSRWPARRWVISDGPGAVWLRDAAGGPDRVIPPKVQEVSATGSGDVMFAAVLNALFVRGVSLCAAVTEAAALAAANAAHPGIAEFP